MTAPIEESSGPCAIEGEEDRPCGKPGVMLATTRIGQVPVEVWVCAEHSKKMFGDLAGLFLS